MLLSSVIPANDTRESVLGLSLQAGIEPGTSSTREGPLTTELPCFLCMSGSKIALNVSENSKCEPKIFVQANFTECIAKLLIKILNSNLPVFLLCAINQSTLKSIYFV